MHSADLSSGGICHLPWPWMAAHCVLLLLKRYTTSNVCMCVHAFVCVCVLCSILCLGNGGIYVGNTDACKKCNYSSWCSGTPYCVGLISTQWKMIWKNENEQDYPRAALCSACGLHSSTGVSWSTPCNQVQACIKILDDNCPRFNFALMHIS